MSPTSKPAVAAELLRNARWMVGLTQAEVAQRGGLTRQVVSSYESGQRSPSVGTLDRLLAGCGLRLRLSVVPEPGLEDAPTLELLEKPPLDRLGFGFQYALADLAEAVPAQQIVVTGKAGARLHGACVQVSELEVWVGAADRRRPSLAVRCELDRAVPDDQHGPARRCAADPRADAGD